MFGKEQFSNVSLVAANINDAFNERLKALQSIATEISPKLLQDPTAVQALLAQRLNLQQLFDRGGFVTRSGGMVIAEFPVVAGRRGLEFSSAAYLMQTLKEGRPTIGKLIAGNDTKDPGIAFTAPLHDKQGNTVGALVGVTSSEQATFFDKMAESRYSKSGAYILLAPQYRMIVSAPKELQFMKTLPAVGASQSLDRFLRGDEGTDVLVSPEGVEVLASAKSIPVAGWSVLAMLPAEEAFAPVRNLQQRALLAAIFLTLLAGCLTSWALRRELVPLRAAAIALRALSKSEQTPGPLPISSQNEIGDLIGDFNLLLETLGRRETALREKYESIPRGEPPIIPDLVWLKDKDGVFLSCNQRFEQLYGALEKDIVGKTDYDFVEKEQADLFRANDMMSVKKSEANVNEEYVRFADDGHSEVLRTIKTPLFDSNRHLIGVLGISRPSSTVGAREQHISKVNLNTRSGFRAFFEDHE